MSLGSVESSGGASGFQTEMQQMPRRKESPALKNCRPDALLAMWALLLILLAHGLRDAAVAHRSGPQWLGRG